MVSLKQIEKKKKFQSNKKKKKKHKATKITKDTQKINPENAINTDEIEIVEPTIEEYLEENHIDDTFRDIFMRFEPKQIEDEPELPTENNLEEPSVQTDVVLSKKKLKKLNRPSVFELKQKIKRPEVVE